MGPAGYRGGMGARVAVGVVTVLMVSACSPTQDGSPAPEPNPSTSPSASPSPSSSSSAPTPTETAPPDPPTSEPLVFAVHVRRPPADLTPRLAGLLLDGGITRWSQLGLPGGRLTVTRKASALRNLAPDTVAIVPASRVGPGVRVLSVDGHDPLRSPDDYPNRAAGPEPGR